jgi:hypothetical protein
VSELEASQNRVRSDSSVLLSGTWIHPVRFLLDACFAPAEARVGLGLKTMQQELMTKADPLLGLFKGGGLSLSRRRTACSCGPTGVNGRMSVYMRAFADRSTPLSARFFCACAALSSPVEQRLALTLRRERRGKRPRASRKRRPSVPFSGSPATSIVARCGCLGA